MCWKFSISLPDSLSTLTDLYGLYQFAPLSFVFHSVSANRRHWKEIGRAEGVRLFTQCPLCLASNLLSSTCVHNFFWVSFSYTHSDNPLQVPVSALAPSDLGIVNTPNYFSLEAPYYHLLIFLTLLTPSKYFSIKLSPYSFMSCWDSYWHMRWP